MSWDFFQTEQKNENQSGCLSTINISAESNDSDVKAWLILPLTCAIMT